MSDEKREPAQHFWVNGIVSARNKMPYIQLSTENGMVAQVSIAQARQIAADILQMSARSEADAMILKFFEKFEVLDGAATAMMMQFRDFRAELDKEETERG